MDFNNTYFMHSVINSLNIFYSNIRFKVISELHST